MMHRALLPSLILSIACGGAGEAVEPVVADTSGAEGAEIAPPTVAFIVAPFTLTDSGGSALHVDADGVLTLEGHEGGPAPRFGGDGVVSVGGETIGTMSPDGTFRTAAGQVLAVIAPDGSTTIGEYNLSFGPDGALVGGNTSGPAMRLSPADSPAKRLAMTALILMTLTVEPDVEQAPEAGI